MESSPAIPAAALPELPPGLAEMAREHHVYQQQMVKHALVQALGMEAGFAAWRELIGLPADARLQRKQLLPLRAAAAARGRRYLQQEAAGEVATVRPPRVLGAGNHRELQARVRSRFVACFGDARVRSRSSAIELEDVLVLDFEGSELAGIDDQLEVDPAIFLAGSDHAFTHEPVAHAETIELAEAFQLSGTHTWAFGHWMWEYLPRYVAADMSGALPSMPVLVDAGMPAQHRQALAALLAPGASVQELPRKGSARVARLWTAPTPMYMPLYEKINERFRWDLLAAHPGRFALVAGEMNRRVERALDTTPAADSPRRVFLARRPQRHRKLLNSPEVEALLQARGFATVYPEELDFDAQVRLVRGADWLIGPEGSAMFLAFFARPGTRLCILNHPYTIGLPVLTGLLDALGMHTTILTGPALNENALLPHFIDYRIEPQALAAFLDGEGLR